MYIHTDKHKANTHVDCSIIPLHAQSSRQVALLNILRRAKVVGFTITQAATFQEILCKLESPVVIVEEAAEVLESHLLAALTPHVKRLVLIGDDCQLKPRVTILHGSTV